MTYESFDKSAGTSFPRVWAQPFYQMAFAYTTSPSVLSQVNSGMDSISVVCQTSFLSTPGQMNSLNGALCPWHGTCNRRWWCTAVTYGCGARTGAGMLSILRCNGRMIIFGGVNMKWKFKFETSTFEFHFQRDMNRDQNSKVEVWSSVENCAKIQLRTFGKSIFHFSRFAHGNGLSLLVSYGTYGR